MPRADFWRIVARGVLTSQTIRQQYSMMSDAERGVIRFDSLGRISFLF
ncbi:MAG: hypothetical protein AAF702_12910 [Chloroflexota bacterium]